ncbi:GNAT family N-acetyltransferase [Calycomorphotria hydatis]|uniref:Putative N-acetyltransferase YafP n=1 Tax=Calycomorphotria hydatis TaxID=2528027 RepID=A0A517TDF6_9PLAN|nr:GNAT family N-acetyltransferase [Calycomorphotria hydatis]QDT66402.1 putative N-acetyltransferase YafP [Calycomorphotria hydatis]
MKSRAYILCTPSDGFATRALPGPPNTKSKRQQPVTIVNHELKIRRYQAGEEQELWQLYHDTVHEVNRADYSQEQLQAWVPSKYPKQEWGSRMQRLQPFVCEFERRIVGFADVQPDGYIDMFFVHHAVQRKGVGRALMEKLIATATDKGIKTLTSNVSITARPFFEAYGFHVLNEQQVEVRGVMLTNYRMAREL